MVRGKERQQIKLGGPVDLFVHIPDSVEVRTDSTSCLLTIRYIKELFFRFFFKRSIYFRDRE